MVGACIRRSQMAYAHVRGISLRRTCRLLSVARSTLHDESRLAIIDRPVLAQLP